MQRKLLNWLLIVLGALIYSVGLNAFLVANHLAEGGLVGISLLVYYKFHIPIGITFFIINIPLLFLGWRLFGYEFIAKTFVGVVALSVFTSITANWVHLPTRDPLLAALYAGVVTGAGLGLIFRAGATTGGADIIARLVRHYYGTPMGRTMFAIDVCVITLVAIQIGHELAMYSLVALFVASRVIDFVLEGARNGKAILIISDKNDEIAAAIHDTMGRGTTLLQAKGGFTGNSKEVVYCVINREEMNRLQNIVSDIDDRAFVVVNDVHEVLGEGFTYESSTP